MSPIIILGLVLMWAVVLVPMWLRRHDEVEESRSVDKFSSAMHTLSRHDGRPAQGNVHASGRSSQRNNPADIHVHVSGASAPDVKAARRRQGAARRRTRLLAMLGVTAAATLVAAVVLGGILMWAVQGVLDLASIGYAVHLRRIAIHAAAARRRADARRRDSVELVELENEASWEQPAPTWEEGITVHRGPLSAAAEDIFDQTAQWDESETLVGSVAAASDGFFDQQADFATDEPHRPTFMDTGPIRASQVAGRRTPEPELVEHEYNSVRAARAAANAAADAVAVGGKPWEPVPVPKPTYAMKPVAPSRPTYQAPRERLLPPVESSLELQADDDLEAILDRRWAVND